MTLDFRRLFTTFNNCIPRRGGIDLKINFVFLFSLVYIYNKKQRLIGKGISQFIAQYIKVDTSGAEQSPRTKKEMFNIEITRGK